MEKLDKPKFELSPYDLFGLIFTIISPLITWIYTKWYYAIILLLSILCIILIYKMYSYSKKVTTLYNNYLEILNNRSELGKQLNKKNKLISENKCLLFEYKRTITNLINAISQGILPINKYEKEYLENLHKVALTELEYLYNLEGGLENGRK